MSTGGWGACSRLLQQDLIRGWEELLHDLTGDSGHYKYTRLLTSTNISVDKNSTCTTTTLSWSGPLVLRTWKYRQSTGSNVSKNIILHLNIAKRWSTPTQRHSLEDTALRHAFNARKSNNSQAVWTYDLLLLLLWIAGIVSLWGWSSWTTVTWGQL
jgi:hypothetical protein